MAAVYTGLPMALQTPRQPALHVRLYPPHGQRADPYPAREPTSGFELCPLARATSVADLSQEVSRIERDSPAPERDIEEWERRVEVAIVTDPVIRETGRMALVQARRGQGQFRDNVRSIERACRITKVERLEHLIASHVQPWRDSNNDQRLDGENGLLLTPTVDHLFDKGFISFEDTGQLIVSPVADPKFLARMGVDPDGRVNVGAFSQGQRRYLEYHRENVLRMARGVAGR